MEALFNHSHLQLLVPKLGACEGFQLGFRLVMLIIMLVDSGPLALMCFHHSCLNVTVALA